jgi:hypothetical protein
VIAEALALDSGTVTVGGVVTALMLVAAGSAGWSTLRADVRSLAKDVRDAIRRLDKAEQAAADHRHDDAARFQEQELRVSRLETHAELTPITEMRPPTGPHRHLRGRPPRPPSDTDAGESR